MKLFHLLGFSKELVFGSSTFVTGPFSYEVINIQKDISAGKPPQNLNFK